MNNFKKGIFYIGGFFASIVIILNIRYYVGWWMLDAFNSQLQVSETPSSVSYHFKDGREHTYIGLLDKFELIQDSKVVFTEPKKIAVLYVATGRYINFWEGFYQSAEKNFLPRHKKTYFLFTDHDELEVPDNVVKIHQDQLQWPYITLKRYHMFLSIQEKLKEFDYIYFINGTMVVTSPVNEEVFPSEWQEMAVTLHPGYFMRQPKEYPYERNIKSTSYIKKGAGKYYFAGGFNGFTKKSFQKIFTAMKNMIDDDLKKGVIPICHDESVLNKYVYVRMHPFYRPLILMPNYLMPEKGFSNMNEFRSQTKLMVLEKRLRGGHNWFRGLSDEKLSPQKIDDDSTEL